MKTCHPAGFFYPWRVCGNALKAALQPPKGELPNGNALGYKQKPKPFAP
jgi:hypothetical protein